MRKWTVRTVIYLQERYPVVNIGYEIWVPCAKLLEKHERVKVCFSRGKILALGGRSEAPIN
jgi:hypothetical protein